MSRDCRRGRPRLRRHGLGYPVASLTRSPGTINDGVKTQQVFGVDVDGLAPGKAAVFDAAVLGYPVASLDQVPPGTYTVQALLHRYETFRRADGHTVKLPMDRGEGQQWNRAPGNLYSTPQKITIDPKRGGTVRLALDQVIPPIPDPPDTKYVKHVRIQSELLTKFWGRPMFLGAHVLLPEGWDTHPQARYPLVINHGHFPYDFDGFRETPPDPDLKPGLQRRASTGRATTGPSRSTPTSSTRTGPARTSRGS